jgi:uncharacterized protein (TIGR00730 family)
MKRSKVITVFGSSRPRFGDAHYAEAQLLGTELAARGFVVCTGGYRGVMEAVSRGAKEAGGRTLGVTAKFFASRANKWLDEEIRVKNWRDRLFELVERGHGYVVCRGGTGTLVELAVVWEMLNKGVMRARPIVAMSDFWGPVVQRVAEIDEGYREDSRRHKESLVRFAASPIEAAKYLADHFEMKAKSVRVPRQGAELSLRI